MNEALKKLAELQISVAEQEDGKIAVFTTVEPLFCFVRSTQEECLEVIKDTLRSYIKNFYNKDTNVTLEVTPISRVRQVRLEARRRVLPKFTYPADDDSLAYA